MTDVGQMADRMILELNGPAISGCYVQYSRYITLCYQIQNLVNSKIRKEKMA